MEICVAQEPVALEELQALASHWHGGVLKAAADIARGVVALGGEWHMDANVRLIEAGSSQPDIWGFNLYPGETGDAAIEYISLINIRPAQGNRGQEIADSATRDAVRSLARLIAPDLKL